MKRLVPWLLVIVCLAWAARLERQRDQAREDLRTAYAALAACELV